MVLLPQSVGILRGFPPRLLKSAKAFLVTLVHSSERRQKFELTFKTTSRKCNDDTLQYKLTRIFNTDFALSCDSRIFLLFNQNKNALACEKVHNIQHLYELRKREKDKPSYCLC